MAGSRARYVAMSYHVLLCVAVCCCVLLCVEMGCSAVQWVAVLQWGEVGCSGVQCVTVCDTWHWGGVQKYTSATSWWEKYITSFYFTYSTMTTVGYGDIGMHTSRHVYIHTHTHTHTHTHMNTHTHTHTYRR